MLIHNLNFRCFALFLGLALLVSFVDNRLALAINTGPDEASPGDPEVPAESPGAPETLAYPSIEDIRRDYIGLYGYTEVVLAITDPDNLPAFFEYARQGSHMSIYDCFPRGYMK